MKHILIFAASALFIAAPAQAEKTARAMLSGGCAMKEQVTVGVSFNQKVDGFAAGKKVFEDYMKKIEDYAAQQKVKLSIQSQNYSVSSQRDYNDSDGLTYQMNGSMSYQMNDLAAATGFAEFLTQQKMQVNLNSNAYRTGGNCAPEVEG